MLVNASLFRLLRRVKVWNGFRKFVVSLTTKAKEVGHELLARVATDVVEHFGFAMEEVEKIGHLKQLSPSLAISEAFSLCQNVHSSSTRKGHIEATNV